VPSDATIPRLIHSALSGVNCAGVGCTAQFLETPKPEDDMFRHLGISDAGWAENLNESGRAVHLGSEIDIAPPGVATIFTTSGKHEAKIAATSVRSTRATINPITWIACTEAPMWS
jgi:hypothetical protein